MKTVFYILLICAVVFLQSCYKTGDIHVQNNISSVKIMDVKWGDIYIATELLPGETSEKLTIEKSEKKLPASQTVSFKMYANQSSVYLETNEEYLLDEDGDLLIILTDATVVKNPNQ